MSVMQLAGFYVVASFAAFIGEYTKAYRTSRDIIVLVDQIYSDPILKVVTANLVAALSILYVFLIHTFVFPYKSNYMRELSSHLFRYLFLLAIESTNIFNFMDVSYLAICMVAIYLTYTYDNKVKSLFLGTTNPSAETHKKILNSQLFSLFLLLYLLYTILRNWGYKCILYMLIGEMLSSIVYHCTMINGPLSPNGQYYLDASILIIQISFVILSVLKEFNVFYVLYCGNIIYGRASKLIQISINFFKKTNFKPATEYNQDDECLICRLPFSSEEVIELPCKHIFHRHCINDWANNKYECPVCHQSLDVSNKKDPTPAIDNAIQNAEQLIELLKKKKMKILEQRNKQQQN